MAAPWVPKRPALPMRCRYVLESIGMSRLMIRLTFSASIPLAVWGGNCTSGKIANQKSPRELHSTAICKNY